MRYLPVALLLMTAALAGEARPGGVAGSCGAWVEQGRACRSAMRLRYEPERGSDPIGMRVVVEKLARGRGD